MINFYNLILKSCRFIEKINTSLILSVGVNNTFYWSQQSSRRFVFRNMSQKSITSFFKATPKESPEIKKHVDKPAKRSRSDSEEDIVTPKLETTRSPSPVTSAKKKKVKRQRIESSGSESETIAPSDSPTQNDIQVKEELENTVVKTYSSPKSKNVKVKKEKSPLVEKNEVSKKKTGKSPAHVKEEKIKIIKEKSPKIMKSPIMKAVNGVKKEKDDKGSQIGPVPETEYNPAKSNYHPVNDACWSEGQEVPYLALAKTFEAIEPISARLKIIEILSNYFRSVIALTPEDLLPSVYMCLNQLAPAYHSLELGIAETYLMKAIGQCTGRTLAQVKAAAHKSGDLGQVAESARATQRMMFAPPPLSARKVFAALKEIANFTGQASVNKKIQRIQSLYVACRHSEARYLIRSLEGKLRIGLAEQSVLQALSVAATATPPPCGGDLVLDAAKGLSTEQFKSKVDETSLIIKTTYCECPNYDMIIPVLLQEGVQALPSKCKLTPGIPLKPMLAHPTKGVHEVFNRFENTLFTCEWKYDGERAQIHVPGEGAPDLHRAAIYSRNQENNTSKYPDVLRRLPALLKETVTSCVLDCEAVAYDTDKKQILPFQVLSGHGCFGHYLHRIARRETTTKCHECDAPDDTAHHTLVVCSAWVPQRRALMAQVGVDLALPNVVKAMLESEEAWTEMTSFCEEVLSTRKRKDANESEIKVKVCVFVFDLLYLNGRPLVTAPLAERRKLMMEHLNTVEGEWQFATSRDCNTMEEVQQFLEESVKGSCEGLMVKTLEGPSAKYDIARRSHNWLKLKKDYLEGVGDTVDAVVIGGYLGKGKRSGVYGGFLLACYDPDTEEYQSLCKIGTGFSEEDLQTLSKDLQESLIDAPRNYYRFESTLAADAWFAPARVWEVRCADLSLSPVHCAGRGRLNAARGVSLRFPRFVRVRDDKTPEQATSAQQIVELYMSQDQVKNSAKEQTNFDDFY